MRKTMAAGLALLVLFGAMNSAFAGEKQDRKALQGTWIPDDESPVKAMTFKGNKLTVEIDEDGKKGTFKCTFKLNGKSNPKGIDINVVKGPKKEYAGKTSLGIYKLEKGKLVWCAAEPGNKTRPTAFERNIGDQDYLLVTFSKKK